jgi:hypothetical protein
MGRFEGICPGSYTQNYRDVKILVPMIKRKTFFGYRSILTSELNEHKTLFRRNKTPGKRLDWRKRWQQKTGILPKKSDS